MASPTTITLDNAPAIDDLDALIAVHKALMLRFETAYDLDDKSAATIQAPLYPKLLATRRALLDHRPRTLDQVRRKAGFMAEDRAFYSWDGDDIDVGAIIAALTPAVDVIDHH